MTYKEVKERLSQCEVKLKKLQDQRAPVKNKQQYSKVVEKLNILKESLQKQLTEMDNTAFVNGQPVEYQDEKELKKFKDNPDVNSIKTAKGKEIKEGDGYEFSKEETMAIAKEVGKAVAKALHTVGDEVAHMKALHVEPNSFEIDVQYKGDTGEDNFSFYISNDTLHLQDFSFDKEIGDVGVKPSGEAIVHVDVLANELIKHFKSNMGEGMTDQEWADAQEKERLDKHPEKSTIEKIQALIAAEKKKDEIFNPVMVQQMAKHTRAANEKERQRKSEKEPTFYDRTFAKDIEEVSVKTTSWKRYKKLKDRGVSVEFVTKDDLNRPKDDSNVKTSEATSKEEEKFHKKLDTLVHKTFGKREEEMNEAPEGMYYIKVAVRDARKALAIIDDQPALRNAVEIDGSDTYYLSDEELAYDLLQDFLAQDIEVTDENIESWDEADPRDGAPSQADSYMDEESISSHDPHLAQQIKDVIEMHAATAGLPDEEAADEIIEFIKKQFEYIDDKGEVSENDSIDQEIRKLQDENPEGYKEDIKRLKVRKAVLALKNKKPANEAEHRSEVTGAVEYDEIIGGIIKRFVALQKYVKGNAPEMADRLARIIEEFEAFDYKMAYGDDLEEDNVDRVKRAAQAAKDLETKVAFGKFDTEHGEMDKKRSNLRNYIPRPGSLEEDEFDDEVGDKQAKKSVNKKESQSLAKLTAEYSDLVSKMKQLAKHYTSAEGEAKDKIVAALKQNTARKRELEQLIDDKVAGTNKSSDTIPVDESK